MGSPRHTTQQHRPHAPTDAQVWLRGCLGSGGFRSKPGHIPYSCSRQSLASPTLYLAISVQKRRLHGGEDKGLLNFHLSSCKKQKDGSVSPLRLRSASLSTTMRPKAPSPGVWPQRGPTNGEGGERLSKSPTASLQGTNDFLPQMTFHLIKKLDGW